MFAEDGGHPADPQSAARPVGVELEARRQLAAGLGDPSESSQCQRASRAIIGLDVTAEPGLQHPVQVIEGAVMAAKFGPDLPPADERRRGVALPSKHWLNVASVSAGNLPATARSRVR